MAGSSYNDFIMNATKTTMLEPGNRIQLPADWAEALKLQGQVALDKTTEGILVRPCPAVTGDAVGKENSDGLEAYPVADFYDPIRFSWTEGTYEIRQILKRYSEATHADP
jgi:hypothetical protein